MLLPPLSGYSRTHATRRIRGSQVWGNHWCQNMVGLVVIFAGSFIFIGGSTGQEPRFLS